MPSCCRCSCLRRRLPAVLPAVPLCLPACCRPALRFRLPSCCLPALCFAALPALLPAALLLLRCALPAAAPFRVSALLRLPPALPLFRRSAAPLCCVWYLYTFAAFRPLICCFLCLLSCALRFLLRRSASPASPASIRGAPPALRLCCVPAAVSVPRAFACRSAACVSACVCCLCCRPACRRAFSLPAVLPCRVPPSCVSCRLRAAASALLSCLPSFLPCLPALLLPACCFAACRFASAVPRAFAFVRFRYSAKARRVPALPLLLPSAAPLCCVWYLYTFAPLRVLCRPFSALLPAVPAPPLLCLPACLH